MTDTTYHLADSQLNDGTIDFYTLLGQEPEADTETLRAKIQAIYAYASANRDHRNLNKRREYQALLELLPAARIALLEPSKRARYDKYLAAARGEGASTDFETFMNDLLGHTESLEDKTTLLGVQENKPQPAEPRARVIKAPVPSTPATTSTSAAKTSPAQTSPTQAPAPPMASTSGAPRRATPFFGAVAGFVIGFVIGQVFLSSIVLGLLIGLVLCAVGYFALNKTPGGRIGT